jgi:hypothetical protein
MPPSRKGLKIWGLFLFMNRSDRFAPIQARNAYWHFGEHTAWDFPTSLRVIISERGRCFPQRKQDMVDLPGTDEVTKGDPPTLDLYRSPSSRIAVLLGGLLMPLFYLRQSVIALSERGCLATIVFSA